ncbi:MAG: benzoylformate decarboxylase [Roseiarcus sp.]
MVGNAGEAPLHCVRDCVIDLIRRVGGRIIFGNPGSTELPLFRNFPSDFRYVLGLQEATVAGMADGYAQATRSAAFVSLHSAAGVGNAMGNIFTAYANRTPMVIMAGQQARSILPFDPFLHSVNAAELPRPYVKWSVEPARAADVPLAIARAYAIAMTPPRGPTFVSIPVDDWDRPAEMVAHRVVSAAVRPDPGTIDRIGAALDASARPAFVVGASVDRDQAWDAVVELAERHSARVWAAPMSGRCGFPEDHPLFAGFLPPIRERIVGLLDGHDVIFAIGAPVFTYHVAGAGPHIPAGAALCQLTDDPDVAARTPLGVVAIGGVRLGVADLLSRTPPGRRAAPRPRSKSLRVEPTKNISAATLFQTLAELRDAGAVIVEEAPSARPAMQAHLPITRRDGFFTMDSGGLGFGMPAAVGIALGKPGTRVIALIGDGSAMYSIQALWSAAQLGLPIAFVILNNRRYAALQEFAPLFGFADGEAVPGTALPGLDFVALANGMGCAAARVADPGRLREALGEALRADGPALLDVEIA